MATLNINTKYADLTNSSGLMQRVATSKDMDIDGHPVLEMSSDKLHHQDAERFRFVVDFGVKPYTPEMQSMYGCVNFSGFRDVIPTFDLKRADDNSRRLHDRDSYGSCVRS